MQEDREWDWRWLYFAARFIYKFSEEEFWNMTPRQFFGFALEYQMYMEKKNSVDDEHSSVSQPTGNSGGVFIDQAWG